MSRAGRDDPCFGRKKFGLSAAPEYTSTSTTWPACIKADVEAEAEAEGEGDGTKSIWS
jgi:hypothetical protein